MICGAYIGQTVALIMTLLGYFNWNRTDSRSQYEAGKKGGGNGKTK